MRETVDWWPPAQVGAGSEPITPVRDLDWELNLQPFGKGAHALTTEDTSLSSPVSFLWLFLVETQLLSLGKRYLPPLAPLKLLFLRGLPASHSPANLPPPSCSTDDLQPPSVPGRPS